MKIKQAIKKLVYKFINIQKQDNVLNERYFLLRENNSDYNIRYLIEGVDLFHANLNSFFSKVNFSHYFFKIYAFFVLNYPDS